MITLVVSNTNTGLVRRRVYDSPDDAREAVDVLIESWQRRRQHQGRGRPREGLAWAPGMRGRKMPWRFEMVRL
jgi:hypothetical protein